MWRPRFEFAFENVLFEMKPRRTSITVILVNEDLGLGWDEFWPPERIKKIKSGYISVALEGNVTSVFRGP